jgi:hypothetical protein
VVSKAANVKPASPSLVQAEPAVDTAWPRPPNGRIKDLAVVCKLSRTRLTDRRDWTVNTPSQDPVWFFRMGGGFFFSSKE